MNTKTVKVTITHSVELKVPEDANVNDICNDMNVNFSSDSAEVIDFEMLEIEERE